MTHLSTYSHPLATKAWKIDDDEHSHIVFCDHGMQARRLGAQGLGRDFEEVLCERYPKLDGFHGDLLGWMIEDGWWFECGECYKRTALSYPGFVRTGDDGIFCSEACRVKSETEWAEKERLKAAFQNFAEVKFFGHFPLVPYVNAGGDAIVYLGRPRRGKPDAEGLYLPPDVCVISRAELGL